MFQWKIYKASIKLLKCFCPITTIESTNMKNLKKTLQQWKNNPNCRASALLQLYEPTHLSMIISHYFFVRMSASRRGLWREALSPLRADIPAAPMEAMMQKRLSNKLLSDWAQSLNRLPSLRARRRCSGLPMMWFTHMYNQSTDDQNKAETGSWSIKRCTESRACVLAAGLQTESEPSAGSIMTEIKKVCDVFVCARALTHSIIDAGMEQQSCIAVSGEVRWAVYEASTTCLFLFTTSR